MKLQIQQALATVLNIQLVPWRNPHNDQLEQHYVRSNDPLQVSLGNAAEKTLGQAVWKAMELANMEEDCHYAIFPLGSNREDYYMALERELLRQEATEEFDGKKMWELLGEDPRQLIEAIMLQLRECAVGVVSPAHFQSSMVRTGCLVVASLQWTSDWISRLKVRGAALKSRQPEPPQAIPFPSDKQ